MFFDNLRLIHMYCPVILSTSSDVSVDSVNADLPS